MQLEVDDPLKPLDKVTEPDERQAIFSTSLVEIHAELSELTLHPGVPVPVRQLFETAKNVSLYSWFVYPFHQVAELVAYSALEFALRARADSEGSEAKAKKRIPGLSELLKRANSEGWLRSDKFPSLRDMAYRRARTAIIVETIGQIDDRNEVALRDPTNEEIDKAMAEIDVPHTLANSVPNLRNALAHGSSMLHPNSRWTLRLIAEAINQLFPAAEASAGGALSVGPGEP